MTQKHFVAIAETIRLQYECLDDEERAVLRATAKNLADVCARFNPNFDRARFLTACGF